MPRKTGDYLVLFLVLLLSAASFFTLHLFSSDKELFAVVTVDGKVTERVDLNQLKSGYEIEKNGLIIRFERGRARILSSPCPDQICVHAGWLTKSGQTAVCVPEKTILSITGGGEGETEIHP